MNIVFDLIVAYYNVVWIKYGQESFRNYVLHGKYQVGYKRSKAEEENDCLVFYPVDKGTK